MPEPMQATFQYLRIAPDFTASHPSRALFEQTGSCEYRTDAATPRFHQMRAPAPEQAGHPYGKLRTKKRHGAGTEASSINRMKCPEHGLERGPTIWCANSPPEAGQWTMSPAWSPALAGATLIARPRLSATSPHSSAVPPSILARPAKAPRSNVRRRPDPSRRQNRHVAARPPPGINPSPPSGTTEAGPSGVAGDDAPRRAAR